MPSWTDVAVGVGLCVALAAVSVLVTGWVVVRLPADYFAGPHPPPFWPDRPPAVRLLGRVAKNLIGVTLVMAGVLMSLPGVPGQGLLTILLGLMCLDLPGKRKLERRLVRRPRVLAYINGLRKRYGRPPLEVDEEAVSPRGER
jgi:hypothetical protein